MKKCYFTLLTIIVLLSATALSHAQLFCNPSGDFVIFSNYDGGVLEINVDQNIPNLKIGIVSYEDDSVIISGPYAANVTQVVYAGFYNSSNIHCSTNIGVKGVYGVSSSIVTIVYMPTATLSNPNGWSSIICNYSCSTTTSQGGCNTADQVAAYFSFMFGSSNLIFHYTQYGCWSGIYNISAGGNCCSELTTGINENSNDRGMIISPNPTTGKNVINKNITSIEIYNLLGENIYTNMNLNGQISSEVDLTAFPQGIYLARIKDGERNYTEKIVLQ